jgi:excinuclease UvrABC ATPase subunit
MSAHDTHPADQHDLIRVAGARTHNLRNISVDIPKRRLTAFTGVSGSGKSSLVFGTIAAESQRMINETYSAFIQPFLPLADRPDVDVMAGLTTAIVIDQERMGANARSTVGTATDANAMLRILYARLATPQLSSSSAYSFNVPTGGMCPRCEGMGTITDIDPSALYDESKSLADGAITVPGYAADGWNVRTFHESGILPADVPIRDYTQQQRTDLLHRGIERVTIGNITRNYEGLIPKIRRSFLSKDTDSLQPHVQTFVSRAVTFITCPDCDGSRLNIEARTSTIGGVSIADACRMQISDLVDWVGRIDAPTVSPLLANIVRLLESFVGIGLGYLSLDRPAGTLSGGEAQRTKMIRHLGSSLTDVTYVFDEPTTGLHPHDIHRMNDLLLQLRDKGNTVLMVEHKPDAIAIADHVVDVGPGAGSNGGEIVFEGTVEGLRRSQTLTGRHLEDRTTLKTAVRTPRGWIPIRGAATHNLKHVDVDIPQGVLVAVTGVAGSGKSSLVHGSIGRLPNVVTVDQSPIRGTRRSSPATYTGLLTVIRAAFAKANGVPAALFSANSEGACTFCGGAGTITVDLGVTQGVSTPCEECHGTGFKPEVLAYRLHDKTIDDVLSLSVRDAQQFFAAPVSRNRAATDILDRLNAVGLGYLTIGQALTTLSGGERQRLKLSVNMSGSGDVFILDEPTTGLHLADVDNLLGLLDGLVDAGKSVIVVEHHLAVMAHADWIIDVGPTGGHDGGRIVFQGTPTQAAEAATLTGQHLGRYTARRSAV